MPPVSARGDRTDRDGSHRDRKDDRCHGDDRSYRDYDEPREEEHRGDWVWRGGDPRRVDDRRPDPAQARRRPRSPSPPMFLPPPADKPYPCPTCNKRFSTHKILEVHRKAVHGEEELAAASAANSMSSDEATAAGWTTLLDPTTNAYYYFNTQTQQSSWTWPPTSSDAPTEAPRPAMAVLETIGDALYASGPAMWKAMLGEAKPAVAAAAAAAAAAASAAATASAAAAATTASAVSPAAATAAAATAVAAAAAAAAAAACRPDEL